MLNLTKTIVIFSHSLVYMYTILSRIIVPDSSPLDEVEDEDTLVSKKRKIRSSHHATTRTPLVTLQGHTQPATGVVWAESGEIVSAGWDMCIRVWDVTTGSNTTTLVSVIEADDNHYLLGIY